MRPEVIEQLQSELQFYYDRISAMEEANAMGDGSYDEQDFEEIRSKIMYILARLARAK